MITQLKLDESAKLEFGISVTGADSQPQTRFIIESADFSIMLQCKQVNENIEVEIPKLKNIFPAGEYNARLEVIIDNKVYTPLQESIVFEPSIEVESKQKPVQNIKESVKVSKVTVKKTQINEDLLRKTQAATIIANALKYTPAKNETPKEIIENSIKNAGELSKEQAKTVNEMLGLAEAAGIKIEKIVVESKPEIIEEINEIKEEPSTKDSFTQEDVKAIINTITESDIQEVATIGGSASNISKNLAKRAMIKSVISSGKYEDLSESESKKMNKILEENNEFINAIAMELLPIGKTLVKGAK